MIEAIQQLKNALAYARFEDEAIKRGALALLNELDTELTGEMYEPGTAIEEAVAQLVDKIDTTDSTKEEEAVEEKRRSEDDEEDQFEGLGDDES